MFDVSRCAGTPAHPENGLGGRARHQSIIGNIGRDFPRVKIGVGEKPRPEYDLADWVLSRLTQAEKKAVEARYDDIRGALELMMKGGSLTLRCRVQWIRKRENDAGAPV
ncbi:MAG: hypothetical protein ACLVJ8_16850 [Ruthenibacterium lactatiformans]